MTLNLDFEDVLIQPKISPKTITRADVNLLRDGHLPLIISNMTATGTYAMAKAMAPLKVLTFLSKEYEYDEHRKELETFEDQRFIGITSGVVNEHEIKKTIRLLEDFPNIGFINIDIANVYANTKGMCDVIKLYKDKFPQVKISSGNVATADVALLFQEAGADMIKLGVGSGSACLTRSVVGVGVPQFSAIRNVVPQLKVPLISDGGCITSGDICKAMAAGAQYVMIGGMVSGTKECGNRVEKNGKEYTNFYGLGSNKMYNLYKTKDIEYRPNEGRDLYVPVTTSATEIVHQIKGALRSVCTYVGITELTELASNSTFIHVTKTINRSMEKYELF